MATHHASSKDFKLNQEDIRRLISKVETLTEKQGHITTLVELTKSMLNGHLPRWDYRKPNKHDFSFSTSRFRWTIFLNTESQLDTSLVSKNIPQESFSPARIPWEYIEDVYNDLPRFVSKIVASCPVLQDRFNFLLEE